MTDGLDKDEELVNNPDECWFRHAFPVPTVDRGEIGAIAFKLHPNDGGKLSGVRSSKQTAQNAYAERLLAKPRTVGTWGVTISELTEIGLRCIDDSAIVAESTGHAYVDLRRTSAQRAKEIRQELADFANNRGRLAP